MRIVNTSDITDIIADLCIKANLFIGQDIITALKHGLNTESTESGRRILRELLKNCDIASEEQVPVCQDTGMAVVFIDIGQDIAFRGEPLRDAINKGISKGYTEGYLRASVVRDPFDRVNTGDNTPAVIHYNFTDGDRVRICVAPKGFGSENMSALRMLKPADGIEGVKKFIVETVIKAGSNPCPPVIVGAGIGGTMEYSALLSKKALLRPLDVRNKDMRLRAMEDELLEIINKSGIGPGGLGGRWTALAVNIEVYPTHIAGLPVSVNMGCHATRHSEYIL